MTGSPLDQIISQMDEEGHIVFQSTLLLGYSARQALYNAYGLCELGFEIDFFPHLNDWLDPGFQDKRLNELFTKTNNKDIEDAFWRFHDEDPS